MFSKYLNTRKKRILLVSFLIVVLIYFSFLYYKLYNLFGIGIPCIFHKITGLYCPGCGITRAIFSLFRFDFVSAIKYNFLLFLIFPFLIYYFGYKIKSWIFFEYNTKQIIPNFFIYILLFITILYGILRNITIFSFLRP